MRGNCREEYIVPCHQVHYDDPLAPKDWHLPHICGFGSSVHVAMQIAVKEGFGPLYLLGCDLGYKDDNPSHFDSDYEIGEQKPAKYANGDALAAHKIAKKHCPVEVYNATIGGHLEVYPRVTLEEVLNADVPGK